MSHETVSASKGELHNKAFESETVRSHYFKNVPNGLTVSRLTEKKNSNHWKISNLLLPCGRCGYDCIPYRHRKQRSLTLVPMRPNPLTGGFPFLHVGWVDEQLIVLELIFNLVLFHATIFCQSPALTTNCFDFACVFLKWLTDCVISHDHRFVYIIQLTRTIVRENCHSKHFTICKWLKQHVFRKADWKNVDSVQNSRVKFFLVE